VYRKEDGEAEDHILVIDEEENSSSSNNAVSLELFIHSVPDPHLDPLVTSFSVADPDPGSDAFLTPESGIRDRFFPDPGSRTHIFESLVTIY
jgi:hypothetical protein